MPIEISEYENFRERLERSNIPTENAVDIENNLLILPMNYSLDDGIDVDFVWYARFSNQLFRELREKDVPVQFIGTGSEPQDVIVKALSPDIILPALFVGFSVWTGNPLVVSFTINLLSDYVTRHFGSLTEQNRPGGVVFNLVAETTPRGATIRVDYRGSAEGFKEVPASIKAALETTASSSND